MKKMARGWTGWKVATVIGLVLFAIYIGRPARPESDSRDGKQATTEAAAVTRVTNRPVELPSDGFVSSDKCKECHGSQYDSWSASYHRTMTQVATPETVIGRFEPEANVAAYGRDFSLWTRDEEFWVKLKPQDSKDPASEIQIDDRIVMTTGSHHMQIYWYSADEGRSLAQVPVAWLKETQSWVPTSSLFISPPGQRLKKFDRRWNEVCIKCHTTNGQPRIEETSPPIVDTRVAEFGISCEACHGPGAQHVALHRNETAPPASVQGEATRIVHPAKLDHRRSAQICGQCHGNWLPDEKAGLDKFLREGTCFLAGEDLAEERHIFGADQPQSEFIKEFLANRPHYFEDRYWSDGAIRVSGGEYNGMTASACFVSGEMSCVSCHRMHHTVSDERSVETWANDQLREDRLGQEACLGCHEEYRDEASQVAHSHHPIGSSGAECYNCHMPHTSYGLLKAIRSHKVSVPSVQESTNVGRPNACNQCHIDKTLGWTADHLADWHGVPIPSLTDDQQTYSATALWCLTGDAGQRALAAWTLGWAAAQKASRTDWIAPVLAQLLADPYDAVRHIAHRSIRTLPGYANFEFRYAGPVVERQAAAVRAIRQWQSQVRSPGANPRKGNRSVLLTKEGVLLGSEFSRLNHQRDNREVLLAE